MTKLQIKTKPLLFIISICCFVVIFLLSCGEKAAHREKPVPEKKSSGATQKKVSQPPFSGMNLSYKIISERKMFKLTNDSLKREVNRWLEETEKFNIGSYTDFILDLTKSHLSFSFGKCASDPNLLHKSGEANCIGYAAMFNSLFNYGIKKKGLSGNYKCRHYVGKIYVAGQNVHAFFNDPFFKDHDFDVIECRNESMQIAVDPSLYDYSGIKRVALKK
jgi:hypothetical protein